jgi:thiol-disulfide isomerase/thioredoxin
MPVSLPSLQIFQRRPWLRDVLLVVVVIAGVRLYQQRDLPSGRAPELSGLTLQGEPVSLAGYVGKPVLVHFWATWCGVCRMEQSNVDAVTRDHAVLSVASQSGTAADVAAYVQERGVAPTVLVDSASQLAKRYGVHAFPTTFILNAHGEIAFREVGYTTELGLRARMWWAGL